jgi:hypothetical protein
LAAADALKEMVAHEIKGEHVEKYVADILM